MRQYMHGEVLEGTKYEANSPEARGAAAPEPFTITLGTSSPLALSPISGLSSSLAASMALTGVSSSVSAAAPAILFLADRRVGATAADGFEPGVPAEPA